MRFIDAIIAQLAMANCLGILLKGIPKTLTTLGMRNFFDPIGCKLIFYLQRVTRDLSLSMTCLLSCFQAITISPSNSKWAELKARAPKHILPSSLCCWIFHLLFSSYILSQIQGSRHMRNITEIQDLGYCPYKLASGFQASLFSIILSFPDAVYVVFNLSTSGYMAFLLYRHHKQIRQVHLTCLSPRVSPENRATKAILLLVSTFVSSYSLNCILTGEDKRGLAEPGPSRFSLGSRALGVPCTMAWPLVCLLLLTCCSGSFSQPVLTQSPSMSASLGATARLSCTLSSEYSSYPIAWQQQSPGKAPRYLMSVDSDGEVDKGEGVPDRFSGSASGADRYLSISNIQAEDEADYYCGAGDSDGLHRATFSEEVGQKPP
ncbi:vomeronasal type-1 receptor 4-like [Sarcophilus harrisii]